MQIKLDGDRTVKFTPRAIAYVLDILAGQPFKDVNALITDILTQLKQQETPAAPEGEGDGKT